MSGTFLGGKRTDDGIPLYALSPYAYSATDKARFRGFLYTASPGTATFDHQLEDNIRLRGGHYWVKGSSAGDSLSFQVVDVDNILGSGAGTVVTEYVSNLPVAPWDHQRELLSPTAAEIPAGLYLRVVYVNTGMSPVNLGVDYLWFLQV